MTTTEVTSGYSHSQTGARERVRARRTAWRLPLLPLDALTITAAVVLAELGADRAHVPPTPVSVLIVFPALTLARARVPRHVSAPARGPASSRTCAWC